MQLEEAKKISDDDAKFVIKELNRLNIAENIYETIWLNIDYMLRHQIIPKFWKQFCPDKEHEHAFFQFQLVIYELYKDFLKFKEILQRVQLMKEMCTFTNPTNRTQDDLQLFKNMLKIDMLSQLPANFTKIIHAFYQMSFNVFANSHQDTGRYRNFKLSSKNIMRRVPK